MVKSSSLTHEHALDFQTALCAPVHDNISLANVKQLLETLRIMIALFQLALANGGKMETKQQ